MFTSNKLVTCSCVKYIIPFTTKPLFHLRVNCFLAKYCLNDFYFYCHIQYYLFSLYAHLNHFQKIKIKTFIALVFDLLFRVTIYTCTHNLTMLLKYVTKMSYVLREAIVIDISKEFHRKKGRSLRGDYLASWRKYLHTSNCFGIIV